MRLTRYFRQLPTGTAGGIGVSVRESKGGHGKARDDALRLARESGWGTGGRGLYPGILDVLMKYCFLTKRSNQNAVLVHPVSELLELLRKIAGILRRKQISSVELEEMDAQTLERVEMDNGLCPGHFRLAGLLLYSTPCTGMGGPRPFVLGNTLWFSLLFAGATAILEMLSACLMNLPYMQCIHTLPTAQ